MILDITTKAEAERLPAFEVCAEPEVGAYYLWADFTDEDHTFFVRPVTVDESGCLVDVFGIRDGVVKYLGRDKFIRESGRLCLLEE
ncbi:hypothetical protein [Streptomyces sp. V3I7]|uniref:hypothetical protein n=1 Tax=Streptomyces sp. V3I7 TaxID=3042278 RepID=UPI00277D4A91|nr:hypothetical protein [Streptomyces sp. V3I7]MDQ0993039.1 hypothetical protein [Streptomyces sp. V3I7]